VVIDPIVVANLVSPADDGPVGRLSERERRVLDLMAQGLTNAGIANRLVVSERTVEAHVRHILTKLDISDIEHGHRRVLAVLAHLDRTHHG
jgi:DNA-binding NarL/FixJ family response regulator